MTYTRCYYVEQVVLVWFLDGMNGTKMKRCFVLSQSLLKLG
jgi:hypothetical protein